MATNSVFGNSVRLVLRAGWRLPAILAGLYLLSGVVLAVELLIIRAVVDELVEGGSIGAGTVLRFAAVVAVGRLSPALARDLQFLVNEGVQKTLLQDVLTRSADAPLERLESPDYQDKLVRAQMAASGHVWAATSGVLTLASAVIASLSLLIILLAVAPTLVPVLSVAGVLMGVVAWLRGRWQYRFEFDDTEAGRERRYLQDALVSRVEGKEIRLAGSSGILLGRYRQLADRRYAELGAVIRRHVVGATMGNVALATALALCLVVVSNQATSGSLSVADAAVAVFAANQLASRLNSIAGGVGTVLQARLFVNDLLGFLDTPTDPVEPPALVPAGGAAARSDLALVLDRVSYRYPGTDHNAIEDVSLRIERGEVVALIGENGAGKTTLAKVAAGLYAPTEGVVRIEASGVADQRRPSPSMVAGVFQDFARYELTVRENVWLGAPWLEPDDQAIDDAIVLAGADDFVAGLPAGLDTRLGKRFGGGVELSLGQWQRLAIARAVFSDAPLVILDEPTAWLDGESADAFAVLLSRLAEDHGVLLISHRTETCAVAHRQVRLSRADRNKPGVLVESATHSLGDRV